MILIDAVEYQRFKNQLVELLERGSLGENERELLSMSLEYLKVFETKNWRLDDNA